MNYKRLLVTGGAGFMGSAFIRYLLTHAVEKVVNLDILTYAGNLAHLESAADDPRYFFVHGDILDEALLEQLYHAHAFDAIVHFAAESHVDRSIDDPHRFYETNVGGTLKLLELVRRHPAIRFHHISTDEVYGSVESGYCNEEAPYRPNSPYAASKAASDHFVRAYGKTYNLSTTISHATNNFGPCQATEKLIPRLIHCCMEKRPLPLYGDGRHIRDWLYVDDHADAILKILERGEPQEVYNVGGGNEWCNLEIAKKILELCQSSCPIHFVKDRPGHDFRYGINAQKIKNKLSWQPKYSFEDGLKKTLAYYYRDENRLSDSSAPSLYALS
jgi:dTDP-glucose 4,6-dehydratase